MIGSLDHAFYLLGGFLAAAVAVRRLERRPLDAGEVLRPPSIKPDRQRIPANTGWRRECRTAGAVRREPGGGAAVGQVFGSSRRPHARDFRQLAPSVLDSFPAPPPEYFFRQGGTVAGFLAAAY